MEEEARGLLRWGGTRWWRCRGGCGRRAARGGGGGRSTWLSQPRTSAYSRWQCRVMYYWYKRMQALPEGADMGGFTRVLHSGKPDGLMDEIPTCKDRGYVILIRPWAFVQCYRKQRLKKRTTNFLYRSGIVGT